MKLSERDVLVLTWIISKKHKTTAAQLTAELMCTSTPVSTKTSVSMLPAEILGCGQCDTCIVLMMMSPPSLSFPHPGELRCGEAPKKLTTQTVACPEWSMGVDQWWFGLRCHGIIGPTLVLDGPRTTEPFWRAMCTQWFKHCTRKVVPCIRMIMHQYTQQDWGQWFDEHESEDEHLSRPAQSPDLNIMSHFGVFWRSEWGNVFFHQQHIVTWPLFCKRNDSKSLWLLCRTCICHSQD